MRPHSAHATPRHATPHTPRARACAYGPDPPYLEGTRSPHVAPIARPAQVLHAEGVRPPTMDELPADFFTLSPAEAKAMLSASAAKREQASVNGNNRYTSLAPSSASCSTNASTSRRSSTTTTLKTVARASAQESVLRTKETREAEAAKRRRVYRKALIRVRFADGLMLQATFSVKAPVSRLLRWVADSLREPHHAFELSIARGETLDDPAKTIEQVPPTRPSAHSLGAFSRRFLLAQVDLAPAAVLNFRVPTPELFDPPYLRADLRATVQQLANEALPQGSGGIAPPAEGAHVPPSHAEPRAMPKWAPGGPK